MKYLIRGDCAGRLSVWRIPETPKCASMQIQKEQTGKTDIVYPGAVQSLEQAWSNINPPPLGVLSQLDDPEDPDAPSKRFSY